MLRVLLVDDEENALDILEILLSQHGYVEVIGKYTNPLEAIEQIGYIQADAVFLDIQMSGMQGIDVARTMQMLAPHIHIVFTTAYTEYALEAFEINSLDYLLKPIKKERLADSVRRIEEAVSRCLIVNNETPNETPVISCLGDFNIYFGNKESGQLSWRTNKEKELCALLVHHHGQVVDKAFIMEALWPDNKMEKARTYLYTCISLLRKHMRENSLPITIINRENGYSLLYENISCDVIELEQLLERILREEELGIQSWKRLSTLYTGDYLGNCDFWWASGKQEQLAEKFIQALRKLFLFFQKNKQNNLAMECLYQILRLSPDSEIDGRELIKLHCEIGNRNEAIKVYRKLEQAVHDHLDVELEEKTVRLYQELVSNGVSIRSYS